MRKRYTYLVVACLWAVSASAQSDTLKVYFDTDDPFLNSKATKLLQAGYARIDTLGNIMIIGYADERGGEYYNDMLSMRRAQSVAAFFREKGVPRSRIKLVYGKGAISRKDGNAQVYTSDRRVDVVGARPGPKASHPGRSDTLGMPALEQMIVAAPVDGRIVLDNMNFHLSTAAPVKASEPTLNELYRVMKQYPKLVIKLEGHVCCVDPSDPSQVDGAKMLSTRRAIAIAEFLVKRGIESKRIQTAGYGKTRPLYAEETNEAERRANRRVEVRILAK